MARLLFLIVVGVCVVAAFRWWQRLQDQARRRAERDAQAAAGREAPAGVERIVSCAVCGLNLPESEALPAPAADTERPARWFCSADHLRIGSTSGGSPGSR